MPQLAFFQDLKLKEHLRPVPHPLFSFRFVSGQRQWLGAGMPMGCSQSAASANGCPVRIKQGGGEQVTGQNVTAYNIMENVVSQSLSIRHSSEGKRLQNHKARPHWYIGSHLNIVFWISLNNVEVLLTKDRQLRATEIRWEQSCNGRDALYCISQYVWNVCCLHGVYTRLHLGKFSHSIWVR